MAECVELTAVEPVWLLRGEGSKFRSNLSVSGSSRSGVLGDGHASPSVTTLLRAALERLEEEQRSSVDYSYGPPIVNLREDEITTNNFPFISTDDGEFGPGSLATPSEDFPVERVMSELVESRRAFRTLRAADDSMAPIVAEGAHVAYAESESISESFHDKLVVAWIEGSAVVRWFQHCGRFALLRAENPGANPPSILVDHERDGNSSNFHRVLWISTPH